MRPDDMSTHDLMTCPSATPPYTLARHGPASDRHCSCPQKWKCDIVLTVGWTYRRLM